MRSGAGALAAACAVGWCAGQAAAVEVRLTARETVGVARSAATITTGVPFARGTVREVGRLCVSLGGKPVPAQFTRLAPWDDGSVRWALMDVQADVPAGGEAELVVSDAGANPPPWHMGSDPNEKTSRGQPPFSTAPAQSLKVDDTSDAVSISTGPLRFAVSKKLAGLFSSLTLDGRPLMTSAGRGLVVFNEEGTAVVAGPPSEVRVEQAGPLRAVVCVKGRFPGVHQDRLTYTARITAFAGQRHVKVHLWLENQGGMGYFTPQDFNRRENERPPDFGWFAFEGMAVELGLDLGGPITARCEDVQAVERLKVLQRCLHSRVKKKDVSTGPFYTWADFDYTITSGDQQLKQGLRTEGVVALKGAGGSLTAAIRDFWQNYEKGVELDGQTLRLWLWPTEGEWPRPYYWLTYGIDKTITNAIKSGKYLFPGAVHKGHEFILDFSGREAKESAAELSAPLVALASAGYYAATEAAPGLFAPPEVRTALKDANAKLDAWIRMARSVADPASPSGLWQARQVSEYSSCGGTPDSQHWFGWMDYGDLCVPGHGPVSLHYDWPWIALAGALRLGDPNAVYLGTLMARHRIDVDQLWSDLDLPEYRGLVRPPSGWPGYHCSRLYSPPSPAGNRLAGLVLYYLLTGEPKALEACTRNAAALKFAWDWVVKAKPYWNPQRDMSAVAEGIECYNAMYVLTGDRKWLDESLALFNAHVVPKWKSLGPFLHDPIRQIQSQDYVQEDMKYCYSIATFCELHHLTGDAAVLRLLKEGCEQEFPDSFFDAPFFLADLYAYVGLVTKDQGLLRKAADSFAAGFPESKSPPVFLPGNSTWSRMSAMMLRTGRLLQYACWKTPPAAPTGRN
jgi:hypothetical protein